MQSITKTIKKLLIENSGYFSYSAGNSARLCQLNFVEGKTPGCI